MIAHGYAVPGGLCTSSQPTPKLTPGLYDGLHCALAEWRKEDVLVEKWVPRPGSQSSRALADPHGIAHASDFVYRHPTAQGSTASSMHHWPCSVAAYSLDAPAVRADGTPSPAQPTRWAQMTSAGTTTARRGIAGLLKLPMPRSPGRRVRGRTDRAVAA